MFIAFLWSTLLILSVVAFIAYTYIVATLVDSMMMREHPTDYCNSLEKLIHPLLFLHSALVLFSLPLLSKGLPILLFNLGILLYGFFYKKQEKRFFKPTVIIRDNFKVKARPTVCLCIEIGLFMYCLLRLIFYLVD